MGKSQVADTGKHTAELSFQQAVTPSLESDGGGRLALSREGEAAGPLLLCVRTLGQGILGSDTST